MKLSNIVLTMFILPNLLISEVILSTIVPEEISQEKIFSKSWSMKYQIIDSFKDNNTSFSVIISSNKRYYHYRFYKNGDFINKIEIYPVKFNFTNDSIRKRQIREFTDNNLVLNSSVFPNVFSYSNKFACNLTERLNQINWIYYKKNSSFIVLTENTLASFDDNGVVKWKQEFQSAVPSTLTKVNENLMAFLCNNPVKPSPENPHEGGRYFFIIHVKGDTILKYKCNRGILHYKFNYDKIIFEGNKLECIDFQGIQQWSFTDTTPYVGSVTKLKNGKLIAGGYKRIYLINQSGDLLKKVDIKTHPDHLGHVYPVQIDDESIGVLGRITEFPILNQNCEIIKIIDFSTNNDYVKNIFRMGNIIVIVFSHKIEIYKFE